MFHFSGRLSFKMATTSIIAVITLVCWSGIASAAVLITEDTEASGFGWPVTPTWSTYTADYLGSGVGVSSSSRYSQTHTVTADVAGTVGAFYFRYANSTLANDTYSLQVYETPDPEADPTLAVGIQVLDVSFTLTKVTSSTHPVLMVTLTGSDQFEFEAGKAYAIELVGTDSGSVSLVRRGGSAGSGRNLYINRELLLGPGSKDSVLGYSIVPEPGSLLLGVVGGVLVLARRRAR